MPVYREYHWNTFPGAIGIHRESRLLSRGLFCTARRGKEDQGGRKLDCWNYRVESVSLLISGLCRCLTGVWRKVFLRLGSLLWPGCVTSLCMYGGFVILAVRNICCIGVSFLFIWYLDGERIIARFWIVFIKDSVHLLFARYNLATGCLII